MKKTLMFYWNGKLFDRENPRLGDTSISFPYEFDFIPDKFTDKLRMLLTHLDATIHFNELKSKLW